MRALGVGGTDALTRALTFAMQVRNGTTHNARHQGALDFLRLRAAQRSLTRAPAVVTPIIAASSARAERDVLRRGAVRRFVSHAVVVILPLVLALWHRAVPADLQAREIVAAVDAEWQRLPAVAET